MTKTGAAEAIANQLFLSSDWSPWVMLGIVYLLTVAFTEMITNNAAAILMFPIAIAVADKMDVNYLPFVIAVMFAASASFITPLGYQTNLMVMGPGGYHSRDYMKIGLPMSLITAACSISLIPLIWHF
jgi:di/tricarboxylate transporter